MVVFYIYRFRRQGG